MSVAETKERVAASIVRARADLEQALADLEHLPEVDARAVAFAAHALGNYLAVTGGTADLLLGSLADHPDRQVRLWLEGISHATNLMTHLATELLRHASKTYQPRLSFEPVDVSVLIERVCHFYRRKAAEKQISITPDLHVEEPDARADRVAVAVVMDNLSRTRSSTRRMTGSCECSSGPNPASSCAACRTRGRGSAKRTRRSSSVAASV